MKNAACGLGQHFQALGHSFSPYGPPSRQIIYIYIYSRQMEAIVYLESIKYFRSYAIGLNMSSDQIFPSWNWGISEKIPHLLRDNKHDSLHLARKYARIFVLVHYLLVEAHSLPWATLSEDCSILGTDVRGQISEHIYARNGRYCWFNFSWVDSPPHMHCYRMLSS